MNVRLAIVAAAVCFSLTACATHEDAVETDGTWVGTITTEGNVTTVVNESGSVWGGTAALVEKASIHAAAERGDDRGHQRPLRVLDLPCRRLADFDSPRNGAGGVEFLELRDGYPAGRLPLHVTRARGTNSQP